MTLTQLHYFCVLAQTQHMGEAAERLFITQSSVSLAIKHLEEELGVPLFERKGRNVSLNHFGAQFYRDVQPILNQFDEAVKRLMALKEDEEKTIIIRSPSLIGFVGLLNRLNQLNLSLSVHAPAVPQEQIINEIDKQKVDFVIVAEELESPLIMAEKLVDIPLCAFVRREHPLAEKSSVTMEQLSTCSFSAYAAGSPIRRLFDKCCRDAGLVPSITYESTSLLNIVNSLKIANRVAILSANVSYTVNDPNLVRIPILNASCDYSLWIYWSRRHKEKLSAYAARKEIINYFSEYKRRSLSPPF